MLKHQNLKRVMLCLVSLLLLVACKDGNKPDAEPVVTVKILKAYVAEKVLIDLNLGNAVDTTLIRKFDDDSEVMFDLTLTWDDDKLVLSDKFGNVIDTDYVQDALLIGEAEVTFVDPDSGLSVDIDVELIFKNVEVLVAYITKAEIKPHTATLVQGLELALSVTLTYSDGEIKNDESNLIPCQSSSSFITVTADCRVSAVSPGLASIELIASNGDVELLGTNLEVLAPSITRLNVTPKSISLEVGGSYQVVVLADYDNGDVEIDVTDKVSCLVQSGGDVISVSDVCNIRAIKPGLSDVRIMAAAIETRISVDVLGPLTLNSGEVRTLSAAFFGGSAETTVTCVGDVFLNANEQCEIGVSMPGEYEIIGTLTNVNTGDIAAITRTIMVNAISLGDLSQSSEFSVILPANTYEVIYEIIGVTSDEIYKVVLFDEFLLANMSMQILPSLTSLMTCRNTVPVAALQNFVPRVACGVRAEMDKLYVRLVPPPLSSEELTATIRVLPDADILQYAGPLKNEVSGGAYLAQYDFVDLMVGETTINGHVPVNLDQPSVSRYWSNLDLGMDSTLSGGDYTISIIFESLNFDKNNAIVLWYNDVESTNPGGFCQPLLDESKINTLTCTFENTGQEHLFVEIRGNGLEGTTISNIAAIDGEISYSIRLMQAL